MAKQVSYGNKAEKNVNYDYNTNIKQSATSNTKFSKLGGIENRTTKDKLCKNDPQYENGREYDFEKEVNTIHLSCASDCYHGVKLDYAGIIIYSHNGHKEWYTASGKKCKSGYLVIQNMNSTEVLRYLDEDVGIHAAVYRNVFGQDIDTIVHGNAFLIRGEKIEWEQGFDHPQLGMHPGKQMMISDSAKECVVKVVKTWMGDGHHWRSNQNYAVKDLLANSYT